MELFYYVVCIEAETDTQAAEVMTERMGHDEELGFDYRILGWTRSTYHGPHIKELEGQVAEHGPNEYDDLVRRNTELEQNYNQAVKANEAARQQIEQLQAELRFLRGIIALASMEVPKGGSISENS